MNMKFKRMVSNFTHFVLAFFVIEFMQCHECLIPFLAASLLNGGVMKFYRKVSPD